jgi:hypothetical protein
MQVEYLGDDRSGGIRGSPVTSSRRKRLRVETEQDIAGIGRKRLRVETEQDIDIAGTQGGLLPWRGFPWITSIGLAWVGRGVFEKLDQRLLGK